MEFEYPEDFPEHIKEPFEKYIHKNYEDVGVKWYDPVVTRWEFRADSSHHEELGYRISLSLLWGHGVTNNYTYNLLAEFGFLSAYWEACGISCPVMVGSPCAKDSGWNRCAGSKFSSAAAEIFWMWSLESLQDEDCGNAEFGNGWHALFRDERVILHNSSQGFVSAWQVPESEGLEKAWAKIEAEAVYAD